MFLCHYNVMSRLWSEQQRYHILIPYRDKQLFSSPKCVHHPQDPPSLPFSGYQGKNPHGIQLTIHLRLKPRLRKFGVKPALLCMQFLMCTGTALLFYYTFSLYLLCICNNGADWGATNAILTTPLLPNIRIVLSFGWLPDGGFVSCCSVFILTAMSHRLSFLEKRHTITVNIDILFCCSYCSWNLTDHSSNTNTLCM